MSVPTEPGYFWAKTPGVHRPRGWLRVRVVRLDDGNLYADDGRGVQADGFTWGPKIPEPPASPTADVT